MAELRLQAELAGRLRLDSLKIQAAIEGSGEGPSRGTQIRALYGAVALVFVLGVVYASVAH